MTQWMITQWIYPFIGKAYNTNSKVITQIVKDSSDVQ